MSTTTHPYTLHAPEKPRYYSPTRTVDAEVGLNEFSIEELQRELAHREGRHLVSSGFPEPFVLSIAELARLHTLALCGQRDAARQHLFAVIEQQIGVKL